MIRFLRENRDVECYPGENLREVALREGIGLYGLKGVLGNCGGCGQCITCFVEIPDPAPCGALSARTSVEDQKLRSRPDNWRLACQALVQESLVVITRPQLGLANRDAQLAAAAQTPLPAGPTSWPVAETLADTGTRPGEGDEQPPAPAAEEGPKGPAGAGAEHGATGGEGR